MTQTETGAQPRDVGRGPSKGEVVILPSGLQAGRRTAKGQAVIMAARRSFVERGYAETRVDDLAMAARVSSATIYAYFPSKEALFAEAVTEERQHWRDHFQTVAALTGETADGLETLCDAYANLMAKPAVRGLFRAVISEQRRLPALANGFYRQWRSGFAPSFVSLIAARVPGPLPVRATSLLMCPIEAETLAPGLWDGDDIPPSRPFQDIARDAVSIALHAIAPADRSSAVRTALGLLRSGASFAEAADTTGLSFAQVQRAWSAAMADPGSGG